MNLKMVISEILSVKTIGSTQLKIKNMAVQFCKWLMQPRLWRFVCFSSTVTRLVSYSLSSSFNHLFGHWNLFKILLYTLFSSIICFATLFAQLWHHSSSSLKCKAHLSVVVLTATTVYSFFYDRAVNNQPDAYSLISCSSFAIMSLGLSRQTHFGFEVDLLYFFLGFLILQLMKIKLLLGIVGVCFSYSLIILRSSLDTHALLQIQNQSQQALHPHSTTNSVLQEMEISATNLKYVLVACAQAIADSDLIMAEWLLDRSKQMVSISGEPIQRVGAYMLEGLVARLGATGNLIHKALKYIEPANSELMSYLNILYEICPYFKFGYISANGAIAEAMKDEDRVHIIDFQIAQGTQWITLIKYFADRPEGPPHIRITGVDNSTSAHARGDGLHIVGERLSKVAEACMVPFEFHAAAVSGFGSDVEIHSLGIRPGEALAVNFAFMLHQVPDESVSTQNQRNRLLKLVKSLSPKVVTLVEQESNTNTAPFLPRFLETLDYYSAVFESIDVVLPRENKERVNVEQQCLARDIVNIIACKGAERVERRELLGQWRSRFTMAGFTPFPLSPRISGTMKQLLENYSDKYRIEEREGALYLGWKNRDLVASSAWK